MLTDRCELLGFIFIAEEYHDVQDSLETFHFPTLLLVFTTLPYLVSERTSDFDCGFLPAIAYVLSSCLLFLDFSVTVIEHSKGRKGLRPRKQVFVKQAP